MPTQRVFHAPEARVQAAIVKMCRHPQDLFRNPAGHPPRLKLIWKGDAAARDLSIYRHMVNRDDAYLSCGDEPVCKSTVYTDGRGRPLEFLSDFQVHILPQGTDRTYVRVIAVNPRVILEEKGGTNIEVKVNPTTVEENEILAAIRKYLK